MQKRTKANLCPECRKGYIIKQSMGWFASVMRCSRHPKCTYKRKSK